MNEPLHLASDFIVVGGGTAGLVIARRLSEAGHSVHVLEAGSKVEPLPAGSPAMPFDSAGQLDLRVAVSMPALAVPVLGSGALNWRDSSASEYGHGKITMSTGKVLGGTSNLNLAIWTRGDALDYDLIAEINNDPSWKFESLKKYFNKTETFHPDSWKPIDEQNYGREGPIHTFPLNAFRQDPGIGEFAHKAFQEAGFKYNGYGNDGNSLGFNELSHSTFPMKGGRQSSVGYVQHFNGTTLHISEGLTVACIVFEGKKAVGVKTTHGTVYQANREVLLCAGALRSPAILQLSGIGDRSHLERCGVQLLHHLPGVGQNLWDHPVVFQKWRVQEKHALSSLDGLSQDPQRCIREILKYNRGEGSLLACTPMEFSGWKNYPQVAQALDDIEGTPSVSQPIRSYLQSDRTPHAQLFLANAYPYPPANLTGSFLSVMALVATPTSRGYVKIASTDPSAALDCDANWLSTRFDQEVMKEAMKTANEIVLKMVDDEGKPVVVEEADLSNDPPVLGYDGESLEKKLKLCMGSMYHYAGTCAMAPLESMNPLPVVDSECRVHGVQGLRVIDASVFPVPISANPQAPVYALAEKLADVILRDYPPHSRSNGL